MFRSVSGVEDTDMLKGLMYILFSYTFDYSRQEKEEIRKLADKGTSKRIPFRLYKKILNKIADGTYPEEGEDGEELHRDILEFSKILRKNIQKLVKDSTITSKEIILFKAFLTYVKNKSESALKKVIKNIPELNDKYLLSMTVVEEQNKPNNQQDLLQRKAEIVLEFTGKPAKTLTGEERKKLRETDVELNKEYNRLEREIREITKNAIMTFVRSSGKDIVPVKDLVSYLNSNGVIHKIQEGFPGYVDEEGNLYTSAKRKIAGSITGKYKLNPNYDPKRDNTYVLLHYPEYGKGDPQRVYTEEYQTLRGGKKFKVVENLADVISKVRKRVFKDIMDNNIAVSIPATVVATVIETSARIGSSVSLKEGKQGISTLKVKNFRLNKNSITITYTGKGKLGGVPQKHIIKGDTVLRKRLISVLTKLIKSRNSREDFVFSVNGKKHIYGSTVNKYLQSLPEVPEGVTIHKFRHVRGTEIATEILSKAPFKPNGNHTDKQVNDWLKSKLEMVGKELGHIAGNKVTAATAIKSYIDPSVLYNFYKLYNVRPTPAIQKILNNLKLKKD